MRNENKRKEQTHMQTNADTLFVNQSYLPMIAITLFNYYFGLLVCLFLIIANKADIIIKY